MVEYFYEFDGKNFNTITPPQAEFYKLAVYSKEKYPTVYSYCSHLFIMRGFVSVLRNHSILLAVIRQNKGGLLHEKHN
jgi:hypothetical protein